MKKLLILCLFILAEVGLAATQKVTLNSSNTISLRDYFYAESVAKVQQKALELDAMLPEGQTLYLVLDSGGGSIQAGLELIETLKHLGRPIKTITIFAASMGFQTVQGLGERLIQKNGTLMSHRARGGFYGEFPGQVETRLAFWKKRVLGLDKIAVSRTRGKHSEKSYAALISDEYWCQDKDCVAQGFADAIAEVKCDSSLSGTTVDTTKFFWAGYRIVLYTTLHSCPLISGELDFEISISPIQNSDELTIINLSPQDNTELTEKIQKIRQDRLDNFNRVVRTEL